MSNPAEDELKCWLTSALRSENVSDFCVSSKQNAEKGDGYMGNIIFLQVASKTEQQPEKIYHLVLKCSKKSEALRKAVPVKEAFENEIHFYEHIVPIFKEFQRKKGVEAFDSLPKFYGSFVSQETEVVVLGDLRTEGYYLCDRKKPLPSSHLRLVLEEYGKWHAISAAMQDQEPEKYKTLVGGMRNVWKLFTEKTNPETFFAPPIEETYELLRSNHCEATAEKLKKFKTQTKRIMEEIIESTTGFSVITHGDCWSNNFMFKSEKKNGEDVLKVAMLDWQTTKFSNPVMDISYFIYACASEEDLKNFDDLLRVYHDSFSNSVRLMGGDPDKIFPFSQLVGDFKWFGKYGVMLTMLAVKIALSDKKEAPDFGENVDGGFQNTFSYKNRDQELLKSRMLYIIQHVAAQDIL